MSCLHKYWLKEFFKFFSIIQLLILVLFVFIDYLSRMEKFLNSDISLGGCPGVCPFKSSVHVCTINTGKYFIGNNYGFWSDEQE